MGYIRGRVSKMAQHGSLIKVPQRQFRRRGGVAGPISDNVVASVWAIGFRQHKLSAAEDKLAASALCTVRGHLGGPRAARGFRQEDRDIDDLVRVLPLDA